MQQKRSIFFPLLLIASGAIWLMIKAGQIPAANLWALSHIWPFLLIAVGVGILLRPYSSYASIVVDLLIIGGVVYAVVNAPKYNWQQPSSFFIARGNELYFGPTDPGSGKVIKQSRTVNGFNSIEVDYPADVTIKQGGKESLIIEAEDNLLPGLITKVSDGTLKISYKVESGNPVTPTKPINITITAKDLKSVNLTSAGKMTIDGFETKALDVSLNGAGALTMNEITATDLTINLSGAGDLKANGTTDSLELSISGVGSFDGSDLHSQTASVSLSGAGGATVWVDEKLDATVSGAGSIHYYGMPTVTKEIAGVGSVTSLGDK